MGGAQRCLLYYLSVDLLSTVDMFSFHEPDVVSDLFQGHKGVPTVEPSGVLVCFVIFPYLLSFIIDVFYVDRSDLVSDLFHGHSGPQGVGGAQCLSVSSFIYLLIYNLLLKYFISMSLT